MRHWIVTINFAVEVKFLGKTVAIEVDRTKTNLIYQTHGLKSERADDIVRACGSLLYLPQFQLGRDLRIGTRVRTPELIKPAGSLVDGNSARVNP